MTQPGVSQHLRKLEAQVGKPLIAQDGKSFSVTPAGEAVLSVGQARRAQERDLQERVQMDDPGIGTVNIGCSGSFALWVYPHLLEQMHHAPELVIRLSAAPQTSIAKGVLNGDLDLGIVVERTDHPRLNATPLNREELCLVLPATFAVAGLNLQRLNGLGYVAHQDGFAYADDLLSLNFPMDYQGAERLKLRTFVNQIGQIPIPVAQGLGYTILPRTGVDAFPQKQELLIYPLPERRYHDLWLIYRQGRSKFARFAAVKNCIERVSELLA